MAVNEQFSYRRAELARQYCDALEGTTILDAASGLFLSAPRRTGKSTFMREDLTPAMAARGWEILYIDLWSDRLKDPAELIAAEIARALAQYDGTLIKAARRAGLEKVRVAGTLTLDLGKIGKPGGVTISAALEQLHARSAAPIALLIDEAQHALSSDAGRNMLFALKAARDQLNQGGAGRRLHLVMTGSNREKLAELLSGKTSAFFGAQVTPFPVLDTEFVEAYAAWLNKQTVRGHHYSATTLTRAFRLLGHMPELLKTVVGKAFADLGGAHALDELVNHHAKEIQTLMWQEYESTWNALTAPQRVVIEVLARTTPAPLPFSNDALRAYKRVAGVDLTPSHVQGALDALTGKGQLWRAGRGDYAFEDLRFRDWFLHTYPESQHIPLATKTRAKVPRAKARAKKK